MSLGHAIMGFLSRRPMTGYDLKTRCFDRVVEHFWTADQAQIYRTLERLEVKGLLTSEIDVQHGRPDRKVYSITEEGHRELKDWLARPRPLSPIRDPFLVQVFFSGELPEEDILALLSSTRREHEERLEALREEIGRDSGGIDSDARDAAVREMTRSAATARTRATIEWLDECVSIVKEGLPEKRSRSRQLLER